MVTKDSNGNVLAEGDSVLLTKDLKVKGFNKDLKRGTLIKNIRLTSDPGEIEGKVEGSMLVVKTMYLKKK
ncbi:MAG: alkylphosphonate utilization protein [Saprospiraceae bacterium]|uniref:Alkylphosphonate utilization protein n=1 Tax=Candidatus Opimibacter skivensis TaxID=2982028 RepID=A0A9D7XME2_9BACT|nr:alkylphosphonate utilization protein [Candidatus Opimibacter skivensis]